MKAASSTYFFGVGVAGFEPTTSSSRTQGRRFDSRTLHCVDLGGESFGGRACSPLFASIVTQLDTCPRQLLDVPER